MRIPEFSAEASLGKPLGAYRTLVSLGFASGGSVQAQAAPTARPGAVTVTMEGRGQTKGEIL